jgi:hypothetical protein
VTGVGRALAASESESSESRPEAFGAGGPARTDTGSFRLRIGRRLRQPAGSLRRQIMNGTVVRVTE